VDILGTEELIEVFKDAIMTGMKVAAPILIVSILVGLIISIIQAATSINEQTMTFVPKLIVIGLILIISGGWMLQQMMDLVMRIFELIATEI
jgi:flagellar biosynthetic protein FliQ